MYNLQDLENDIKSYPAGERKLPRGKHAVVKLNDSVKYLDLCVLSNINIGLTGASLRTAKEDKPFRLNKFKAHIAELANDPNARVMLGGDLFYFPPGGVKAREMYSPNYDEQLQMLVELLLPIKDKIIGAYDGTDEIKIFEKDGVNVTKKLVEALGLEKRYFGQMAEVDFEFKNAYTNGYPKVVHTLFDHGFLVANVMNTVAKKTEGLESKIAGKDFYFTSHYNKLFIEKTATLSYENGAQMIKKPCYFVSVGGYRDFPNRLTSNRNVAPSSTNNGIIRMFVAPNPDRNNIRGNNYLGEPQYKICQEFINFGTTTSSHLDFDLCEEIMRMNEQNTINKGYLVALIEQKIDEINKQNTLAVLERFYGEQEERAKRENKQKRGKKQIVEKVIIDEIGGREWLTELKQI